MPSVTNLTKEISTLTNGLRAAVEKQRDSVEYLEDHVSEIDRVTSLLQDVHKKVRHKVMVPFGDAAFFPGHLLHTNECMVKLGQEHMVEYSTHQAQHVLQRQKQKVQREAATAREELQKCEEELRKATGGLLGSGNGTEPEALMDVREEYDAAVMGPTGTIEQPVHGSQQQEPERGKPVSDSDLSDLFSRMESAEAAAEKEESLERSQPLKGASSGKPPKPFARGFFNKSVKAPPKPTAQQQPQKAAGSASSKTVPRRPEVLSSVVERRPDAEGLIEVATPQSSGEAAGSKGAETSPETPKKVSRFKQQRLARAQ